MAVETYTKSGSKATTATKMNKDIFGVDVKNHELLKLAYLSHLANKRANLAQAKSRGEVSGGGQKPWRQKGTGRARFGSSRNPIWRGGGVAFGPTGNENYSKTLSVRAKRQALRQALSLAAADGKIKIIEAFDAKEGRVAPTLNLFKKIDVQGSVLLVLSLKDKLVDQATGNLPQVKVVQAKYLSVFDILNADQIVLSQDALNMIHEWLNPSAATSTKELKNV